MKKSLDQEGMDLSKSGQNFQTASDRINHARGDPSSFSAGTYQDPNGWSGGNEAEGYNTSSGFTAGTSNRLEEFSSGSGNVFGALGRWSDAVKLMSANIDRGACATLLEEIAALQDDVASRRCATPSVALRSFIDCPLPGLCARIIGELERCGESELPFAEHVSAILDDFVCIQDPACTGKQELAEALAAKNRELKDLSLQLDAHVREREKVRSEQQELAEETMRDLESTTDCLLSLQDEQERIKQSLKEVRLKAAQQRLILESTLEKSGHSIQPMRTEDENELSSRDVDMSGPSAQSVTIERQQEKARGVVLAVQDHINLVYRTADFVKEARSCMGGLVHSMMVKSLQDELETLSQDQEHAEYLRNQLKESPSAPSSASNQHGPATPSVAKRYKSFYTAQLRNMTARHILSRYAAEGLIAYIGSRDRDNHQTDTTVEGTAIQQDSDMADLARQIVDKLDGLRDIALPDDPPGEVMPTARESTLALCGGTSASQHQSGVMASLQCAAALGELAARPAIAGSLIIRGSTLPEDRVAQTCSLVLALGGLGMVPSDLTADLEKDFLSAALVVSEALDAVLCGKSRNSVCVLTSKVAQIQTQDTTDEKSSANGGLALLQARIRFQWLSKIAVVDIFGCFERPNSTLKGAGVRFFAVDNSSAGISSSLDQTAAQGASSADQNTLCKEWRKAVEAVSVQVAEFVPDLIIACIRCKRSNVSEVSDTSNDPNILFPRKLASEDWIWAGRSLSKLAGRVCQGRLVIMWDLAGGTQLWHGSVSDMTLGVMSPSE
eukprot:CAMPEP_0172152210 /NCGR_PEP_ID=MMETSP1050-20130122/704_1 /TAXON_ID=233186 /ORGANISM="Cryptomonas curvata, Strain CCAP979/52" /LENGTH=783 /DNA_ID=CAMNT_0012820493 /DNA_START=68 /DNA_END=2419 /DNA_ORIENTATION=-